MSETAEDKLNALVGRVGKVRRWLIALVVLRIAALCLIFTSAYIGIYAWLDHRFNFGEVERATALILLLAGIGFLLHRLTKLLLSQVSCSGAANHIENSRSFNQQLVTAMEYYEKAVKADPELLEARMGLAFVYSRMYMKQEALSQLQELEKRDVKGTYEQRAGRLKGEILRMPNGMKP